VVRTSRKSITRTFVFGISFKKPFKDSTLSSCLFTTSGCRDWVKAVSSACAASATARSTAVVILEVIAKILNFSSTPEIGGVSNVLWIPQAPRHYIF
jgi:hypothetical protein